MNAIRISLPLSIISLAIGLMAAPLPQAKDIHEGKQEAIQGTVAKVDLAGNKLTVQTDNKLEQTVAMDEKTSIKMDGQPATVADLKEGQQVSIVADGMRAISVEVLVQTAAVPTL